MKLERSLCMLMMAAALLEGSALASRASSAPQPATAQSSETSTDRQKDEARNQTEQTPPKEADEIEGPSAGVTRTGTTRRSAASHPKPVPSPRLRPAKMPTKNSSRPDAPGRVAVPEPTRSKAATSLPNRSASRRPSELPSAVSVNGQQFKNRRDPGSRLGVSGGPPSTPRGTAAIDGTNMKRRP